MKSRLDIRVSGKEKSTIQNQAKKLGMTMSDYIRYKLIDSNLDLGKDEFLYYCPSSEKYNYVLVGTAVLIREMLELLMQEKLGEKTEQLLTECFRRSKHLLEAKHGWRRINNPDFK